MTKLIINDEVGAEIKRLIERAEQHPLALNTIMASRIADDELADPNMITLKDRRPGFERPPSMNIIIPTGFRVALSIEEQPGRLVQTYLDLGARTRRASYHWELTHGLC